MKSWKSFSAVLASLLAPTALIGSATATEVQAQEKSSSRPETRATGPSRNLLNDLAWKLQRQMAPKGNLIWSPSDSLSLMALYYEGAVGETRERAANAWGVKSQADRWGLPWSKLEVETAKQILLDRGDARVRPIPSEFQALAEKTYGAKIESTSFQPLSKLTTKINAWVNDKTQGLIPCLVEEPDLQGADLILLGAIYFKAKWEQAFEGYATREDVFRVGPKEHVKTQFMNRTGEYSHFDGDQARVLILPYEGRRAAMAVVLAREGMALEEFEGQVSANDLQRWIMLAKPGRVWVKIPKFEHGWRSAMDQAVIDIGFPREGDFSRMGQKELQLTKMIHQALIRVNELGTEAAASTIMAARAGSAPSQPKEFHLNRPFLYFIYDEMTGTWAFSGRFAKP
jgi:serpin B